MHAADGAAKHFCAGQGSTPNCRTVRLTQAAISKITFLRRNISKFSKTALALQSAPVTACLLNGLTACILWR